MLKESLTSCKAAIIDSVNPDDILPFVNNLFSQSQISKVSEQKNKRKAAEELFNMLTNRPSEVRFLGFVDALFAKKYESLVKKIEDTLVTGRIQLLSHTVLTLVFRRKRICKG
jgi:hypothetical protein